MNSRLRKITKNKNESCPYYAKWNSKILLTYFGATYIIFDPYILFENYSKCLVTLFDRKLQIFKNSAKLTIFAIFNERLTTQNENIARLTRNVE